MAAAIEFAQGGLGVRTIRGVSDRTWMQHLVTTDIDRLAAEQPGWRLRYEQLSEGPFHAEVRQVQLPGVRLLEERLERAVRQHGQLEPDAYGFALAADSPGPMHFAGRTVQQDTLMMGRGDDIDLCTPPGFAFIAIVVDRALLAPLWQQLYGKPLAGWLEHQVAAEASATAAAAVRERHRQALAQLFAQPSLLRDEAALLRLRDELLLEWLGAIPPRVQPGPLAVLAARRKLVERACELALAHPESPPSMAELCRAVGASPRKLTYCFADVLGTSPARYLRALRLNAARAALRRPESGTLGVQDVAARLGFWHFGQFASDYRRLFGERPSQTLRAARGSPQAGGA